MTARHVLLDQLAAMRLPAMARALEEQLGKPEISALSFEERLGTQWTVWVGGIALAFGGFFLVRYSIEQGYFGPGMRVFLGALLAVALIAAGEWSRRSEKLSGITGLPTAHIPTSMLPMRSIVSSAPLPRSCCSARLRLQHSRPRWCTDRRLPGLGLSAPMSPR